MNKALAPKQAAFVSEYLIDLNVTQAAIRAGYCEKTANKIGTQLLGKTSIAEAIKTAQAKRARRTEITQEQRKGRYAVKCAAKAARFRLGCLAKSTPSEGVIYPHFYPLNPVCDLFC